MPLRAVVVGCSRGIGLALVEQLSARGDEVIGTCRQVVPALQSMSIEVVSGVDVTKTHGIERLVGALGRRSVDLLIHNAGVLTRETLDDLAADRIRHQFEVNALAPLLTIAALRPNLHAGSKVGIVTSRMGSIEDNTSGSMYGYRMSKAAVNAAGKSLAQDLRHDGVAVALLHPGFVRTDMTRGKGYVDTGHSATGLIARLDALSLESTGRFWHADGPELPW
ncbi:MAG: short-chain dehydrogenase [Deltaproteobacteria bacterium]|nr:short-chain dehydrogenase [Deltaproteobacteria bacterium]